MFHRIGPFRKPNAPILKKHPVFIAEVTANVAFVNFEVAQDAPEVIFWEQVERALARDLT